MIKVGKYTCRNMGVKDTTNGKYYTEEMIKNDPELKKYIERRMNENIQRAYDSMYG